MILRSESVQDKLIKKGRKKLIFCSQPEILVAIATKEKSCTVAFIHVTPGIRLMKLMSLIKGY